MTDWAIIDNAIAKWLRAQTGLTVYWAEQDFTQAAAPFATLKRTSGPAMNGRDAVIETTDTAQPVGKEVGIEVVGQRSFSVSCQVFAASTMPAESAQVYLDAAQASLGLPSVREAFHLAGCAAVRAEPVKDISAIMGSRWKSRAVMDIEFRAVSSVSERTGYVGSIGGEQTYTNQAGSAALVDDRDYGV